MLVDSHAHLTSSSLENDVEGILARAHQAQVDSIINICTHPQELEKGIALHKEHPWVYNVGATTPHDVEKEGEECFDFFATQARSGHLVAVGETGLDYHYAHSSPVIQQDFLRRYLRLASECRLPVVIHCREAFEDFFSILDEEYVENGKHLPGVLHCFTGTLDEAREVIKRGWYLSLSGIVTFKKSEQLREVAREVPLEQLLIETDAPYLAPQKHRGKTNEPAFIVETALCIAEVKGISFEALAEATASNAKKLFRIS